MEVMQEFTKQFVVFLWNFINFIMDCKAHRGKVIIILGYGNKCIWFCFEVAIVY